MQINDFYCIYIPNYLKTTLLYDIYIFILNWRYVKLMY